MTSVDLLDQIDPARHDTASIVDRATAFADLPNEEQDALDLWEYAGLEQGQHPLSALLHESHNQTCVVRDLDGKLWMLAEESTISDRWSRGPLCRGHLIDDGYLVDLLEDETWLRDIGIPMSEAELRQLLDDLPDAPGPVMSF